MLISGKIAILDENEEVISENDLGNVLVEVDSEYVLSLNEELPTLGNNQSLNVASYFVDRANNVVTKTWTVKDLGPESFPLTPAQLRLGLIRHGISVETIESRINAIPLKALKDEALIFWEYSTEIHWEHPMTQSLMAICGISPDDAKIMWLDAKNY